jgi:hypothetical protein
MSQQNQIQIQFRLVDVKELQFVNLANEWPEGELQINNQLQFNCDTEKRAVRCNANFEYKKNDITQLILGVQTIFEFTRESWSSLYQLDGDQWVLPAGLVQHLADITIGSARGILAVRSEEAGIPKQILPLVNPGQMLRNNIAFKRIPLQNTAAPIPMDGTLGTA